MYNPHAPHHSPLYWSSSSSSLYCVGEGREEGHSVLSTVGEVGMCKWWRYCTEWGWGGSNGVVAHSPWRFFWFLAFLSVSSALCAQKIEIFEIWAFLVKKPGLATKKSEISKFRVFWSKNQVWPPKNRKFRNFGFFGQKTRSGHQKMSIFKIWGFWSPWLWLFLRKLFFLLRSSQQLPRLRLGPLKGFLSWHGALQGPSTRLVRCFRNVRERGARTPAASPCSGGPSAPQKMDLLYWSLVYESECLVGLFW